MLNKNTSFIIGAGGSRDFGFPLGSDLRDRIIEVLSYEERRTGFADRAISSITGNVSMAQAGPTQWPVRQDAYRKAAAKIRNGLPFARSIDGFLDSLRGEPDIEFLAKLAIAAVILRAEASSAIANPDLAEGRHVDSLNPDVVSLAETWHAQLGQILFEGHTRDTLDDVFKNASFIVFNYDRCLEEFLATSLARRFAIDRSRAIAVVASARIVHPYGLMGDPWKEGESHVPFGALDEPAVARSVAGIRTFSESLEEATGEAVKDCIAKAETLVFLGFGWLPQNMELLRCDGRKSHARRVFATTMGMPPGEIAVVGNQLEVVLGRYQYSAALVGDRRESFELIHEGGDCKSLMTNCWLRLTASQ
ncbi:hypothetical protein M2337_000518 [Sphingobium sp. B2D3A]|uniref:hypothetical protein n=1 Tax=unclassified Sphingobium TaxID=2611147 RepID=UPI0022253624|nr:MULTISPECIES: hypothetical protein [unclassified Sphingobium]MCW2336285.1 hypothetical protein [Sphingobium sp. B2D3A]MCW2386040.1 hypothetical protein [Sphingobium sp. B2D3D]